jgi:hypothetical protein
VTEQTQGMQHAGPAGGTEDIGIKPYGGHQADIRGRGWGSRWRAQRPGVAGGLLGVLSRARLHFVRGIGSCSAAGQDDVRGFTISWCGFMREVLSRSASVQGAVVYKSAGALASDSSAPLSVMFR